MGSKKYTWEELKDIESGTILEDAFCEEIRYLIMRNPASLCAYIGIPETHLAAGLEYDDVNIDCHGGLTFGELGDGKIRPSGFYWYGWDYAHSGDKCFYDDIYSSDDKEYLIEDVRSDIQSSIYDFKKFIKIAEQIARK